jgi:preprotein translocase subunit SecD
MDWSKKEQVVLGEMKELPAYELTPGEQARMFEQVMRRVRPARSRRPSKMVVAAAACVAVAVLGSVGYMERDALFAGGGGQVVPGGNPVSQQSFHALYEVQGTAIEPVTPEGINVMITALKHRMEAVGLVNPVIQTTGQNRLSVAASGQVNVEEIKKLLVQQVKLEFKDPDGHVVMTGKDLAQGAHPIVDQAGQSLVMAECKDPALFEVITQHYVGKEISIWLDGSLLQSSVVQDVVHDGKFTIHTSDPQQLAMLFNGGTLPFAIKEVQE